MRTLSDAELARLTALAGRPDDPARRYTLHEVLGEGGMGTVYRGTDELLEREVAIKVARAHPGPGGAALVERLRTEARVLARLEHPGIVPVHDAGMLDDGRVFYVMKHVHGVTLDRAIAGVTEPDRKLGILERVAEAVAFAHQHGVVHRDLKPENIMIGPFGEVLVMDWGTAKILDAPESGSESAPGTDPSAVMGTAGFMAPEQAHLGAARTDRRADVYALGMLLVYLMEGAVAPAPATPEERDWRTWPRRLAAIARTCLASDPDARYPDAGAVAEDIARYRAGAAVAAYRERQIDRLGRWISTYRTPILLVLAYILMRTLIAWWPR